MYLNFDLINNFLSKFTIMKFSVTEDIPDLKTTLPSLSL